MVRGIDKDLILDGIVWGKNALDEVSTYIEGIEEDNKKVYTESKNTLEGKESLVKGLMVGDIRYNLQGYMVCIAGRYLTDWLRDKGISRDYKVEVCKKAEGFSECTIVLDGEEFVWFNLKDKSWSQRYKGIKELTYEYQVNKRMARYRESIKEKEMRLEEYREEKQQSEKITRKILGSVNKVILRGDNIKNELEDKIKRLEDDYSKYLKGFEERKEEANTGREVNMLRLETYKIFTEFFNKLGYEELEK